MGPSKRLACILLTSLAASAARADEGLRLVETLGPITYGKGSHRVSFVPPATTGEWFLTVDRDGPSPGRVELNGRDVVSPADLAGPTHRHVRVPVSLRAGNALRVVVHGNTRLTVAVVGLVPAVDLPAGVGRRAGRLTLFEHTVRPGLERLTLPAPTTDGLFDLRARTGQPRPLLATLLWNDDPVLGLVALRPGRASASAPVRVLPTNRVVTLVVGPAASSMTVTLEGHVVDEAAPVAAWTAPAAGALLGPDDALVLAFSDALTGVATVRVELDGADVTSSFDVGAEEARSSVARLGAAAGAHTLRAVVRDRACGEAAATVAFRVDLAAPILEPPADLVVEQRSPAGSVVTFDAPRVTDDLDPAPDVTCAPAPGSLFPPGATTVTCTASDASGKSSQVTFTVTVRDTIAPALALEPADGAVVEGPDVPVRVTWSDAGAGVDLDSAVLRVDGQERTGSFVRGPEDATATLRLTGGQHLLEVGLRDLAGNERSATSRFEVRQDDVVDRLELTIGPPRAPAADESALLTLAPGAPRALDGSDDDLTAAPGARLLRDALASAYADGVSAPAGPERPSARAVSNALHAQDGSLPAARRATDYLWMWGQLVSHDLSLTRAHEPAEPLPIPVPAADEELDPAWTGTVTLPFRRSRHDVASSPREQTNELTAWLDGSVIYGADATRAAALRAGDGTGRLRTGAGDLLPLNTGMLDNLPSPTAPMFFLAGDVRANQNPGLLALHTVLVREHNRLADLLRARFPQATDEELYRAARRVVVAELQAITYQEFLPALLGPGALAPSAGHDPDLAVGIDNAFATAAFRVGHSLLSPQLLRLDAQGGPIAEGPLPLRDGFFAPARLTEGGGIEPLLRGAAAQTCQALDPFVVDDVRSYLFGAPGQGGLDLAALDLQRGRDHGLPSYNEARRQLGLEPRTSFAQVTPDLEVQARLARAYPGVDDVDLLAGGLCEAPVGGGHVGELFARLIARQFELLRDGDREFYTHAFSGPALEALRRTRLSDVIRRNTTIGAELQDDVFTGPLPPFTATDFSVRAVTRAGATATSFTGFVTVSVSDGKAPLDGLLFELTPADQGQATFPGLAFFQTLGPLVITARSLPLDGEAQVSGVLPIRVALAQPVVFPALPASVPAGRELTLQGLSFPGQQVELLIDGQLVATEVAGPGGAFTASLRLEPGAHTIVVRSTDPATGQLVSSTPAVVEQAAPPVVALEVTPAAPRLAVGQRVALAVLQRLGDGSARDVTAQATYASRDAGVASVSGAGVVTGTGVGSATLDVTLAGLAAEVVVDVGVPILVETSPAHTERGVAPSRETVLRFSAPLDPASVTADAVHAEFAGQRLAGTLHLSADRRTITLFYAALLPASARVRLTVAGDLLRDAHGNAIDVDRDGVAGGTARVDFDTLTITVVPGTVAFGRVFASRLAHEYEQLQGQYPPSGEPAAGPYDPPPPGGDIVSVSVPLQGARISVVGAEDTLFTFTDALGDFRLDPAPAGTFFVHVEVVDPERRLRYPDIGKPWTTTAGEETGVGDIYLPIVDDGVLQVVSATADTVVGFTPEIAAAFPHLAGTEITVPAGSLYGPGEEKRVGLAPVPPDRLPAPLPEGLAFSIVFTIQTAGGDNFDVPAPVRFPNTERLAPGTPTALWSFNHDTGQWEVLGGMTVSADGLWVVTDPGVGIVAPGWHGWQSGAQGEGGASVGWRGPRGRGVPQTGQQEAEGSEGAPKEPCNIYLHNGEETFERVDLAIVGRGHLNFVMRRRYRSQNVYDGPLGHGWDYDYNEFLRVEPNGDATRVDGRGHVDRWVLNADGTYRAPKGFFGTLSRAADGSFRLREPSGFVAQYDPDGRLVLHTDRFGNSMAFVHDEEGDLDLVIDVYGREIDFTFQTFSDDRRRLTRVRDFAGREVLYSYDQRGDLVAVRSPIVVGTSNGNDFPSGRTERYTYSSGFADHRLNHNILTLTHPEEVATGGPPAFVWTYGEDPANPLTFDRVVQRVGGGTNASGVPAGGVLRLEYSRLNEETPLGDPTVVRKRTRVTKRNGNVHEHDFNEHDLEIASRAFTRGLRESEPAFYETRSFYDDDGQLVRRIFPEGNETRWRHDSGPRGRERNVVEIRRIAGPRGADGRGAAAEDLVTTFTYEPLYHEVSTITDPRGNSATFVPPLGENVPGRYTTRTYFDYQEHDGPVPLAEALGIDLSSVPRGLGDLNGDGRTDQSFGNVVRIEAPAVLLPADSQEAARRGTTVQTIVDQLRWNDRGQLLARVDPEGNVTTFTYYSERDPDGDGQPTFSMFRALTDQATGYQQSVTHDAGESPRRTSTTPPTALTSVFRYDPVGNLIARQDPRGVETHLEVNALCEVVSVTRGAAVGVATMLGEIAPAEGPLRYRVRHFRDHDGRVIREEIENRDSNTEGVGPWVDRTFQYDLLSNLVKSTLEIDATASAVTQYRYDANENLIETIKPEGNRVVVTHDERDFIHTVTRGAGSPRASTTRSDYDRNGNEVRFVDAEDTDGDGAPEASSVVYDGFDRPIESVDALGNREVTSFDPANNQVARRFFGHPAGLPAAPHVLLSEVTTGYDERHRAFRSDERLFVPAGQALARAPSLGDHDGDGIVTTRFEFDALSRQTFVLEDDLELHRFVFDGASRLIETVDALGNVLRTDYDRGGNVIRVTELDVPSDASVPVERFVTRYTYDQLGRVVRATDNAGQTIRQAFDSRDNLIARSDPEGAPLSDPLGLFPGAGQMGSINTQGNTCFYVHDGLGRVIREVCDLRVGGTGVGPLDLTNGFNPDGQISLRYVYDRNSRVKEIVDDNGRATSYGYDDLDRMESERSADGETTVYTFDRDHNVRALTDPNGSVITKTFDALNRVVQSVVARGSGVGGTTWETFAYDGLGRLTRSTDDNGAAGATHTYEVAYDSVDRPLEERFDGLPVSHSWNGDGKRRSATYSSGRTITFAYDAIDRIERVSDVAGPIWQASWIGAEYRELHRTYGNGATLSYLNDARTADVGYDAIRRHVRVRHLGPQGTPVVDREYTYNRANIRTSERRNDDFGLTDLYRYDSSYRLSGVDYDQAGAPSAVRRTTVAQDYTYDGAGNRRSAVASSEAGSTTTPYAVNEVNEYTAVAGVAQVHDDEGNLLDDGSRLFAYDYRSRLIAAFDRATGRPIARYEYFADGRRARKALYDAEGVLVREVAFTHDHEDVAEERNAVTGLVEASFVYAPFRDRTDSTPIQLARTDAHPLGAGVRYLHENGRGDIVAVTNDAGAVVAQRVFDDFGHAYDQQTKAQAATNVEGNPFWFQGQYFDQETGLYHLRARYYAPNLGRFVQRDPVWDPANVGNAYAYVGNSPISHRDPRGLNAVLDFFGVGKGRKSTAVAFVEGFASGLKDEVSSRWDAARKRIEDRAALLRERGDSDVAVVLGVVGMEVADRTGMTDLYEAKEGYDLNRFVEKGATHKLSTGERVLKGLTGGVSLATSAVGGAGSLAKGRCALTKGPGGNCFVAGTLVATDHGRVAIETVQVGDRVLADETDAPAQQVIDPAAWRLVRLTIANPDGSSDRIRVELLRPVEWVLENVSGGLVQLHLDELDLHGTGVVEQIADCPAIDAGAGRVVTATFTHLNAEVVEVWLEGSLDPIRATRIHRFCSEERGWIAAGHLVPGERLRSAGPDRAVARVQRLPGTHRVFNLEVEGSHTFYVSNASLLAHNNYFQLARNKPPVQRGDVDSYAGLKSRAKVRDKLEHDHIPSAAAIIKNREDKLGHKLTAAERRAVYNDATAVERSRASHVADSPTFGGRNNKDQISADARNLDAAQRRDLRSYIASQTREGVSRDDIAREVRKVRNRNRGRW